MFRGGREHTGPSKTTAAGRRRGETNAMTYASGRTFYDADSHIMELPDFLKD